MYETCLKLELTKLTRKKTEEKDYIIINAHVLIKKLIYI